MTASYDIAVIGGGINGTGVARDASGRGLKVLLCEKNDLASGTSSASTKLIHGGLRYLEHYEFQLVRESLSEREVLWSMAPHIVWPLRFILPHNASLRPAWMIRLGLFLYDHIGGRKKLPASRGIDLRKDPAGFALKNDMRKAFEYSDLWVNDAQLVVLNAIDAAERGADVRVGTELVSAERGDNAWQLKLRDNHTGVETSASAKVVVNAGGPWVADVLGTRMGINSSGNVRLVKGSHIVVPRIADHDRAYIFQGADRRIIFAIPYENDFTLIGTTDVEFTEAPGKVKISSEEIDYLCDAVSTYFMKPVMPEDVVWSYSGVRPLYDDGKGAAQEVTRDYVLERHGPSEGPAAVNVFGGKLTTYRRLSEDVMAKIEDCFPEAGSPWTRGAVLPGGGFNEEAFETFRADLIRDYQELPTKLVARFARSYGTRARDILGALSTVDDLGHCFGDDLFEIEVRHLMDNEWAHTAEDILWRRSKMGLRLTTDEAAGLQSWIEQQSHAGQKQVS